MKKFSKLLAVVLAVAVIICPMMSVVANASASDPAGTYNLSSDGANDVILTLSSTDGFMVYQATVTFNSDTAFQSSYSTSPYTNGIKVVDYAVIDGSKDSHNAPKVTVQKSGAALEILVMPTDDQCLDLYSEIQIGFRVATGSSATLSKIQAANDGTEITDDAELLDFPAANSTTGVIDQTAEYAIENAVTNAHEHNFTAQTVSAAYLRSAATCSAKATYYYACTVCGAAGTTWYENGEMLAHTATNTTTYHKSDASCTEPLTYYQECSVCHAQLPTTWTSGSALGHNPVEVPAKDSTCTVAGNDTYYRCTRCEKVFTTSAADVETTVQAMTRPLASHTPENTKTYEETATTCTTDGVYYQTCKDCKVKLDTTWTDIDSHLTSANHTGTLATAWSSDGTNHWHEWSCCGKKENVAGHTGGEATHSKKAVCSECGAEYGEVIPHTFDQKVVKNETLKTAADCQHAAVYYYSCSCGVMSDSLTFTDGDVDTSNHADGCTLDTSTWKTNEMGHWHEYTLCETQADYAEHTFTIDEIVQPTKDATGSKTYNACTCGATHEADTIAIPTAITQTINATINVIASDVIGVTFPISKKVIMDTLHYSDYNFVVDYQSLDASYNRKMATKVYRAAEYAETNAADTLRTYKFKEISSYDIGAHYTATVYMMDAEGIVVAYKVIDDTSIIERLNTACKNNPSSYNMLSSLANAVQFSSALQDHFAKMAANVNSDLALTIPYATTLFEYNNYATDLNTITAKYATFSQGAPVVTSTDFMAAAPSVMARSSNVIRLTVKLPLGNDAANFKVVAHYTDGYGRAVSKTYQVADMELYQTNAKAHLYYIYFDALNLYDLEKTISFDVVYNDITEYTYQYKTSTYVNSYVGQSTTLGEVARANAALYEALKTQFFSGATPYNED